MGCSPTAFSSPSPFSLLLVGGKRNVSRVSRAKAPPTKRSEKGDGDESLLEGYFFDEIVMSRPQFLSASL